MVFIPYYRRKRKKEEKRGWKRMEEEERGGRRRQGEAEKNREARLALRLGRRALGGTGG